MKKRIISITDLFKVNHRLDLRGKICPYPTRETNLTLKKMAAGEVLEIISDYYPVGQGPILEELHK